MSSKFWMTTEDPFYDEDGVLIDEDADWEDEDGCGPDLLQDELSPYRTVNS